MTVQTTLRVRSATKVYGGLHALDDVTMGLDRGECVALVGPNGAGKSTLFKLILGLIRPSAGEIEVMGRRPGRAGFDEAKRHIGFLPEQVRFHGALSGRETLTFYARLKQADRRQIDDLLDRVDLGAAADRRVHTYSKGMRQRLGLAQALIGAPRLLLLDEPTSGLDPQARTNFFSMIAAEQANGATILLSSHALTELEARTDRVAILHHGQLMADGSIAQLTEKLSLASCIRVRAGRRQMAQLADQMAGRFDAKDFVNGIAVLDCRPEEKLPMLRELVTGGIDLESLDIVEPSLERIFSAYTSEEAKP
jgi:Cu-processing system ATP-binding protein